jgi:hypothetical protein
MQKTIIILLSLLCFTQVSAQITQDTIKTYENRDTTLMIQNDTMNVVVDSAYIRRQEFIRDSIIAREKFIQDSLIARAKFVKDSLYRRKVILDSVTFLQRELPRLVEAALKSVNEEIIISTGKVDIIGDSILGDFTYRVLSQKIEKPYAPWRATIPLDEISDLFKIKIDTVNKKIISLRLPDIYYSFDYNPYKKVVRMDSRSTIITKKIGNFYKYPIDSVFFDRNGRVEKIKKYIHYYKASKDYKKGASVAIDIVQIKNFDYFSDGVLSKYSVLTYCDRFGKTPNKECHKVTYSITREGRKFIVLRKNEPENVYSDGTFTFEFDSNWDMKFMEFAGRDKKLNRKCFIELNEDRNVSRYLFEKEGRIHRTITIDYDDSPNAKHKVEIIIYYFEDDNISYHKKNITTGKSCTRNKLTMKWGPWR